MASAEDLVAIVEEVQIRIHSETFQAVKAALTSDGIRYTETHEEPFVFIVVRGLVPGHRAIGVAVEAIPGSRRNYSGTVSHSTPVTLHESGEQYTFNAYCECYTVLRPEHDNLPVRQPRPIVDEAGGA